MIFQSLDYVAFLLALLTLYWLLPRRGQNLLLLVASGVFYGYVHPWFLGLLLFTTTVSHLSALGVAVRPGSRKLFLSAGVVANLGLLGFYKYFGFFVTNLTGALRGLGLDVSGPALDILLPVGISFFTFQAVAYLIDVYRGEFEARRSWLDVALFISFFPQLVAGPIERARHLLPQIEAERVFDGRRALDGATLLAWGFFKKLVIADNVALVANKIFALEVAPFPVLWSGVFAFGVQILADFSAYTDIARGTAKLFGINLIENFRHPYGAGDPGEFWRRWHISLSSWLRDYVYVSLGGSRVGRAREAANVMATFLLSGLWHGAAWNFVLWGAFHGALVLIYRWLPVMDFGAGASVRPGASGRLGSVARVALFFALVHLGWLFFREADGAQLLRHLSQLPWAATALEWEAGAFFVALAALYSLPLWLHAAWDAFGTRLGLRLEATAFGVLAPRLVLGTALYCAILLLRAPVSVDFIYFQF